MEQTITFHYFQICQLPSEAIEFHRLSEGPKGCLLDLMVLSVEGLRTFIWKPDPGVSLYFQPNIYYASPAGKQGSGHDSWSPVPFKFSHAAGWRLNPPAI